MRPGLRFVAAGLLSTSLACAAPDDTPVAREGNATLGTAEVKALLAKLEPAARKQATKDSHALAEFVRAELGRRAILEQAKKVHWDQRDDIAQKIARTRDEIIMATYLSSVAAPPAGFPGDAQVKSAYEANLSRFMAPRQFHLAQIYVARPPAGATPDQIAQARAKAEQLDQKAKAKGADFAQLAKANSEDKASLDHGGDLGWVREDQLVPEIAQTVKGLRDDEISDVIEAADGWHVIRELGTKPAGPRPLDEVKPSIVTALRQTETNRLAEAYVEKLLNDGHTAVNEIALQQLVEAP
jgi:peptidylprolyl isomerase